MQPELLNTIGSDYDEPMEPVGYDFGLTRRGFVQILGAGLLIAVSDAPLWAQRRGGGGSFAGSRVRNVAARVHIGKDGSITVMTGKVEAGQGSRAELTQAAAEELRVPVARVQLLMADTALVPDDGMTAGSRTSPASVPAVRQGCAAARKLLVDLAAEQWKVDPGLLQVRDGKVTGPEGHEITYADLAALDGIARAFDQPLPTGITLTPLTEWRVLGTAVPRPNRDELVTGVHEYPSDIVRPGMLHGKILRAPSYGATLASIDLAPAQAMQDVVVVRDGNFVGVAAPTSFAAEQALTEISKTAKWETKPQPASADLYDYLREHANGGVPENPFPDEMHNAAKSLRQTYHVAYIQHAPMEPRSAVAEWGGQKLTVWMSTQNPFGCRGEIARAFGLPAERVRVIVPDFGGGFGGKHTAEEGIEAARLAQAAGRPVALRWTRAEEFTWAYFRPAGVIDIEGAVDSSARLTCWHHVNINSGRNAIETPYRVEKKRVQFVDSAPPLRHGSYRGLAGTANIFARESFMDELAHAAGVDPLEFRLMHLEDQRLRNVLQTAADKFDWKQKFSRREPNIGVGLACGTEKGSFVAACAEVSVDREQGKISVHHVCQAFECGAILNPDGLLSQVQGAIIMGMGGALREAIAFEDGHVTNASFWKYEVPRLRDVPELDIHLINRPDLPSAGAGETPIMAIAPAIANAVFHATGIRVRQMPIRLT